jgi:hypothetical protein
MSSPTNLDTLLKEILITPLVGAMMERGIKPPRKCECVTEYALNGNPDRIVEWADEKCPLCDGDGIQKRDTPLCAECGDETCEHGGCRDPHCPNVCRECMERFAEIEHEAAEAAYQREVAGPLLGLDEEQQ